LIARFGQDLRAQSLIYFALSQALLGKIGKALEPVYDFFTGGADFADVREAHAVLTGLDG
jgi:hypothetical protein